MAKCTWIVGTVYNKNGTTTTQHCNAKCTGKHRLCPTHIIISNAQIEECAATIRAGKEEPIDL